MSLNMAPVSERGVDLNDPCGVCGVWREGIGCSMECADCKAWVHYRCTKLPLYQLLTLATTKRPYTCEKCAMDKYSGRAPSEWFESARASLAALGETRGAEAATEQGSGETANTAGLSNSTETSVDRNAAETETIYPGLEDVFPSQMRAIGGRDEIQESPTESVENAAETVVGGGGGTVPVNDDNRPARGDIEDTTPTRNTHSNTPRTNTTPRNSHNRENTPICRFYKTGTCKYGTSGRGCQRAHPRPCARFMRHGLDKRLGCKRGRYCRDYHPLICRGSLFRGFCENRDCEYTHLWGTRRSGNPRETGGHAHSTNAWGRSVESDGGGMPQPPPQTYPHHHAHAENFHQQDRNTLMSDQSAFLDNITQKMTEMHQQAQTTMMQKIAEIQHQTHTLLSQVVNRVGMLEQVQGRGNFGPHY